MRRYNFILWIFSINILSSTHGLPVEQDKLLIEGDIQLTPEQYEFFSGNKLSRNVFKSQLKWWPHGTLVYSFERELHRDEIQLIKKAMDAISSQTCVRFRLAYNTLEPRVVIGTEAGGCFSEMGFQGQNQILNLNRNGCFNRGIIMHELLHALGFAHMQSDPNRDDYVEIKDENIKPEKKEQFYIMPDVFDFNLGYDYGSIMHYKRFGFSKNDKETIIPLEKDVEVGQRTGLSPKDVLKLKIQYCGLEAPRPCE